MDVLNVYCFASTIYCLIQILVLFLVYKSLSKKQDNLIF